MYIGSATRLHGFGSCVWDIPIRMCTCMLLHELFVCRFFFHFLLLMQRVYLPDKKQVAVLEFLHRQKPCTVFPANVAPDEIREYQLNSHGSMRQMFRNSWTLWRAAADATPSFRWSQRQHRSTFFRDNYFWTGGVIFLAGLFEFLRGLKDGYEFRDRLATAQDLQSQARKAFVNGDVFFTRQCQRQALDLRASVLKDSEAIHVVDIPRWAGMHAWDLCARLVYDGTIGLNDDHLETSIALAMYHLASAELEMGDIRAAFPLLAASMCFVVHHKMPTSEWIRNMIRQGDALQMLSSFKHSLRAYEWTIESITISSSEPERRELRMPLLRSRLYNTKFVTCFSRGEFPSAMKALDECIEVLNIVDDVQDSNKLEVVESDEAKRCQEIIARIGKESKIRLSDILYVSDTVKDLCVPTQVTASGPSILQAFLHDVQHSLASAIRGHELVTKKDVVSKIFDVMKDDAVDILKGLSPPESIKMEQAERLKLMVRKYFKAHLNRLEAMCFAGKPVPEVKKLRDHVMSMRERLLPFLQEVDSQWLKRDGDARYYATILHASSIVGDVSADPKQDIFKRAEESFWTTTVSSTRARFLVGTATCLHDTTQIRDRLQQAITAFGELDTKMTPRDRFYYALALQRHHELISKDSNDLNDDLLLEANFQVGMIFGEGVRWPYHPLWSEDVYKRNVHRLGNPHIHYIERLIKK
jgi:hypothetical protein